MNAGVNLYLQANTKWKIWDQVVITAWSHSLEQSESQIEQITQISQMKKMHVHNAFFNSSFSSQSESQIKQITQIAQMKKMQMHNAFNSSFSSQSESQIKQITQIAQMKKMQMHTAFNTSFTIFFKNLVFSLCYNGVRDNPSKGAKLTMNKLFYVLILLLIVCPAHAQVTGFNDSDNFDNSNNWRTAVITLGGTVNSDVNFDTHPAGVLNGTFYSSTYGVTMKTTGDIVDVRNGAGPGQVNDTSPPTSHGEGLHRASNYLFDDISDSTLVISFDKPVYGAGLFIIDNFNPSGAEAITIEAFTGIDGTGTSLGIFTSESYNFQTNYMHFLGIASAIGDIRSVIITDTAGGLADRIGYDDILFATALTVTPTPTPAPTVSPTPMVIPVMDPEYKAIVLFVFTCIILVLAKSRSILYRY
jgi:hypothetical protein